MTTNDVFFFCADLKRDPCALNVFRELEQLPGVEQTGAEFDGMPVLCSRRDDGSVALFVRTEDVVSNDYSRYAGPMAERFGKARLAVVVNWHDGANAPDRVLTFHSTGDVSSGVYGPTTPTLFSAYTRALERERIRGGISDYRTVIEATHWSGVVYNGHANQINLYPRPIYDMEIGSSPECWADSRACAALARVCAFGPEPITNGSIFLYCGGVHFEENVTAAILSGHWHVGHVLPNHWLVSGEYDLAEGSTKLKRCISSYTDPASVVAIHKGLASKIKSACANFAERSNLRAISHKQIRTEPT